MFLRYIHKCRLCGNQHLTDIIDLGRQYSQGFFCYKNQPLPPFRKIPTKIVRCDTTKQENACGLVQNSVIVPPEILYSNYGYTSSTNQEMSDHLKELYNQILSIKGNLNGKIVCDIGCNDGTFLKNFDRSVKKIGIDPSDIARSVGDYIIIINECFPTKTLDDYLNNRSGYKIDVITAWACLYDMSDIKSVMESINKSLTNDGIFVFEVAYLPTVLKDLCFDGMVHEHISLFSFATLEYALKSAGLKAFKIEKTNTNSGSLVVFTCKEDCFSFGNIADLNNLKNLRLEEFSACLDEEETYESFRRGVESATASLVKLISDLKKQGKSIHILGASTKLNTILGVANIDSKFIDCASERNPKKWGGKLLNGIPMVSEEESRKTVNVYLVGPYHFKKSILEREKTAIMNGVEFIFPLPDPILINKDNYGQFCK